MGWVRNLDSLFNPASSGDREMAISLMGPNFLRIEASNTWGLVKLGGSIDAENPLQQPAKVTNDIWIMEKLNRIVVLIWAQDMASARCWGSALCAFKVRLNM